MEFIIAVAAATEGDQKVKEDLLKGRLILSLRHLFAHIYDVENGDTISVKEIEDA